MVLMVGAKEDEVKDVVALASTSKWFDALFAEIRNWNQICFDKIFYLG